MQFRCSYNLLLIFHIHGYHLLYVRMRQCISLKVSCFFGYKNIKAVNLVTFECFLECKFLEFLTKNSARPSSHIGKRIKWKGCSKKFRHKTWCFVGDKNILRSRRRVRHPRTRNLSIKWFHKKWVVCFMHLCQRSAHKKLFRRMTFCSDIKMFTWWASRDAVEYWSYIKDLNLKYSWKLKSI